jgi:hypothetical protein
VVFWKNHYSRFLTPAAVLISRTLAYECPRCSAETERQITIPTIARRRAGRMVTAQNRGAKGGMTAQLPQCVFHQRARFFERRLYLTL